MHKSAAIAFAAMIMVALLTAVGLAQSADDIIGTWEALDADEGELIRLDFGEDGVIAVETFDVEFGFLALDQENHLMAIYEDEEELEEPEYLDWAEYRVQGNRLTIIASPEDSVVLNRVDRPEKAKNALIGSWTLDIEDSTIEFDEDEAQMVLEFYNDGTASYQVPDEKLAGTFFVDAEMRTMTMTIEDDAKECTYEFQADKLSITINDEAKVFERVN